MSSIKVLIITDSKDKAFKFLQQKLGKDYKTFGKIYEDNSNLLLEADWILFSWVTPTLMHTCQRADCIYIDENFGITDNTYEAIIRPLAMSYHYFNLKENKDNDE